MRIALSIIVVVVLSASPVSAQQLRDQKLKPDKPAPSIPLRPAKSTASSCAQYGPGFVKVERTDTCMKVGGSISIGVGGSR